MIQLTSRFADALQYMYTLHHAQPRKGSDVPYLAHLLSVAALVLENGGDEDQAIAALLHDAPEDQGGLKTLVEIRQRFGERVASIVDGLTDTYLTPKPPWRNRKELYIAHLRTAPEEVRLVSLADKLHNARSILADLQAQGPSVWQRFNGGKEGSLWYYRALLAVFEEDEASPMVGELKRVVEELEQLSRG
jgi:(p)ppGpp synthase/HD superfamily hydrolase